MKGVLFDYDSTEGFYTTEGLCVIRSISLVNSRRNLFIGVLDMEVQA